jgi:3-vinyl bacteriochlorophyllide hydratase
MTGATTILSETQRQPAGMISAQLAGRPSRRGAARPLYTPEERARRDGTRWTLVQGILAPVQFLVFLVSLALVVRYLSTGVGEGAATASIVAKTMILYLIMVTGAIWEKVVFGRYLFAPAFFWEDVFSMLVLALHSAYLVLLFAGIGTASEQMLVALLGYAAYVINAGQFVWKLRMARLDAARPDAARLDSAGGAA